jgi:flagellar motor switch protein FliN/FliY
MPDEPEQVESGEASQQPAGVPPAEGGSPPTPPSAIDAAAAAVAVPSSAGRPAPEGGTISQDDIEALLNQAESALASVDQAAESASVLPPGIRGFEFKDLTGAAASSKSATLELMRDVQLDLTIELGRTHMHLEDVLKLQQGAVVALDKLAGDPADIYVNGRLVARGEILVLNDNFCVRVAELIAGEGPGG